ncbi:MAG: hypothetical protein QM813_27380 [Verrucomicrobiota bacterium]
MLLTSLKVEERVSALKISASIPDSAQAKLERLPAELMVYLFSGGIAQAPAEQSSTTDSQADESNPPAGEGSYEKHLREQLEKRKLQAVVKADFAEGLPPGATLSVQSGWSDSSWWRPDDTRFYPLFLTLKLKEKDVPGLCVMGKVNVTKMTLVAGEKLKFADLNQPAFFQVFNQINFLEELNIPVEPSLNGGTTLEALEGTFQMLVSKSSEEFSIPQVTRKATRPVTDPKLKSAGVTLKLGKEEFAGDQIVNLTVGWNEGYFIRDATFDYGNGDSETGRPLAGLHIEDGKQVLNFHAFQDGFSFSGRENLKFKLHSGVENRTVGFKFSKVPLPPLNTRPAEKN